MRPGVTFAAPAAFTCTAIDGRAAQGPHSRLAR
jgi:hypothetical protein